MTETRDQWFLPATTVTTRQKVEPFNKYIEKRDRSHMAGYSFPSTLAKIGD
jgi:hypothetical protein